MIILGSDQENKLLAKGGNYMELSIQIKKYRTELHLSQEELAENDLVGAWRSKKYIAKLMYIILFFDKI